MANQVAGSIRSVEINGVSYRAASDANISQIPSRFENDVIPTSGDDMRKMTRRNPGAESIPLILDADEANTLKEISEGLDDVSLGYTTASNDTYTSSGWINFETYESEEKRGTIKMFPRREFAVFVA